MFVVAVVVVAVVVVMVMVAVRLGIERRVDVFFPSLMNTDQQKGLARGLKHAVSLFFFGSSRGTKIPGTRFQNTSRAHG